MSSKVISIAAIILCALAFARAPELTADDVIAKNVAAIGGIDKLHSISSMRASGSFDLGNGHTAHVVQEWKKSDGDKMRMEMGAGPNVSVRVFDGKNGWEMRPELDQKEPTPMNKDELAEAQSEADMFGPLVDYKAKGNQVELLGHIMLDDQECYQLKITLKDGSELLEFIDANTCLETRTESVQKTGVGDVTTAVTYSDYRNVEGVTVAFATSVETSIANKPPQKYSFKADKVEINPKLNDADFNTPAELATTQPSK